MKTTRNNFNVTSTRYRNGVKIGQSDKCEVLRVTHARDHTSYHYKLSGCTLQSVIETVDLGVLLTLNLSLNTQTQNVVNKAKQIVGFLKRNVGLGNKEVFSRLYKALHGYTHSGICCPSQSKVGPRNTLSRWHLGTLRTKKDWQCLGGPTLGSRGFFFSYRYWSRVNAKKSGERRKKKPLVTGVRNLISMLQISSAFELGHRLDTPMSAGN